MTAHPLLTEARLLLPDVVALRREIHRHPEVGNQLPRTRALVLEALEGLPLTLHLHNETSGVVALLEGGLPGPSIILRGDMDGLRISEATGLEFASEVSDTMHACGHDLHTAMLVGAARLLAAHQAELQGSVVFMFQPGEEGHHGARFMLEEGLLDVVAPRPTGAFAIHVSTTYAAGTVNHLPGPEMAAADELFITVQGSGGHASAPYLAADPIAVAAEVVLAIEVAITRQVNAFDPAVVTFGSIHGGTAGNVIPATVDLHGTIRTFSEQTRTQVHEMLEQVATHVAGAHGLSTDFRIVPGYPVTVNDPDFSNFVTRVATDVLGSEAVTPLPHPIMGAEDWSYVLDKIPGVMAFLGACPPDLEPGSSPANHSDRVVFEESVMAGGIALHAEVALSHLARG